MKTPSPEPLGRFNATWLLQELRRRHWRQSELVRRAGIRHATLSALLAGGGYQLGTLRRMSAALDVPVTRLIERRGTQ